MKNILIIIFLVNCAEFYAQNEEVFISQVTPIEQPVEELQYSPKEIVVTKTIALKYPLAEYEAMITRCNELSDKILEYKKEFQNGSIKKTQIKALKKDLVEAKLLSYRLDDFTSMYHNQNYPVLEYLSMEMLSDYHDFSKVLASATQYAGF